MKSSTTAIERLTGAFNKLQTGEVDVKSGKENRKQGVRDMVCAVTSYAEEVYSADWRDLASCMLENIWNDDINPHLFVPAEQSYCGAVYDAVELKWMRGSDALSDEQSILLSNYEHIRPEYLPHMRDKAGNYKMKFTHNGKVIRIIPNSENTFKNAMKNAFIRGDLSPDMESKNHMATGKLNVDITDDERFRTKLKSLRNFINKQKDEQVRDNWRNLAIDELNNL